MEIGSLNHKIKLTKRNERHYLNREYRFFENEEKIIKYNSFIFPNVDVDESFSKVLSFYLYEFDNDNKRKNVVISFSNQTIIFFMVFYIFCRKKMKKKPKKL